MILGSGKTAMNPIDKVSPQAASIRAEKTGREPGAFSVFPECEDGDMPRSSGAAKAEGLVWNIEKSVQKLL